MVARRGWVLLRGKEAVEIRLLFGRLAEGKRDGGQGKGSVQRTEIVPGCRQGVNVTSQAGAPRVLDLTQDEARLGVQGPAENTSDYDGLREDAMHIGF